MPFAVQLVKLQNSTIPFLSVNEIAPLFPLGAVQYSNLEFEILKFFFSISIAPPAWEPLFNALVL